MIAYLYSLPEFKVLYFDVILAKMFVSVVVFDFLRYFLRGNI